MGSSSLAQICQRVTDMIRRIFVKWGYDVANYLDDFGATESVEWAERAFNKLAKLFEKARVREAQEKAWAPSTYMVFLGIGVVP